MNILMVIPARSGSRRLPHKNIKFLGNKPLLCWSMDAAAQAGLILHKKDDQIKIIVSTDSESYQKLANRWWMDAYADGRLPAPFLRPADISEDVDTGLVVKHAWEYSRDEMDFDADYCVTLQPTSPFRTADDIVKCVKKALEITPTWATVFTVKPVTEFPRWMMKLEDSVHGEIKSMATPYLKIDISKLSGDIAQDQPELYIPNGAVYVTRRDIIQQGQIYGDFNAGVVMEGPGNVDIETLEDFEYAEFLLSRTQSGGAYGSSEVKP